MSKFSINKQFVRNITIILAALCCLILISLAINNNIKTDDKEVLLPTPYTSWETFNEDMIILDIFIPQLEIDLIYAGDDNVYGEKIYDLNLALLRRGTARKLQKAQEEFALEGYTLKIWDAYRPPEAQYKLWEIMPDARYVVNPYKGYSFHSRGIAVDVTLVDKNGKELPMPSSFDDFTAYADRDYSDVGETEAANARLLEKVMCKHGFRSIYYEWWHFVDPDGENYPAVTRAELPLLVRIY